VHNNLLSLDKLNIDLSFISIPFKDLDIYPVDGSLSQMQSSYFWSQQIAIWIKFIQLDKKLKCPEIVRSASKFSLGLELTDDEKILELNKTWLGKAKSTDVLSFPIIDETLNFESSGCIELGDIVIAVPTAINQAKENNINLITELRWLVSHGLLHLLGWDHCDEESLNQMLKTQEQLLDLGGIV